MKRIIAGTFWVGLYLVAVLAPMFLMLVGPRPPGRSFWVEFSLALGFVGLTQIGLQFVLIARYRRVTAPYGIDVVLQHHRRIALLAFLLILAHPIALFVDNPGLLRLLNPFGGTWASRSGLGAVTALALLIGLSVFRQRLKINYEWWRITHTLLGIAALILAHTHVSLAGSYLNTAWKQAIWKVFGVVMLTGLIYLRLVKPALQRRLPWRVAAVRPERGETYTLALDPLGHDGLRFMPGQCAWLKLGETPYTIEEHPFSFSSSAEITGRLEFGIKALGDFTRALKHVPIGTPAWVDGPHGAFSIDLWPAAGYVFIAGGIGITPMLSFLKTMADREDVRPILLLYGDKTWDGMAFRDEIEQLKERLNLKFVPVLEAPPENWRGESGFVTADLLERQLPREKIRRQFFLCGPPVMMEAVQAALVNRGVPLEDIHSEQFNLI
jgi:predicted ferric reductase